MGAEVDVEDALAKKKQFEENFQKYKAYLLTKKENSAFFRELTEHYHLEGQLKKKTIILFYGGFKNFNL